MAFNKALRRQKIRYKIRNKIAGSAERPRISVFRSNKYIYGQVIDDDKGVTLAKVSSKEETVSSEGSKKEIAKAAGMQLAERAKAAGVSEVVFDRSGYLYHGRIQAFAEGLREGGLNL